MSFRGQADFIRYDWPYKSGGARVIYLNVPEAKTIVFITLYTKNEKSDLSGAERNALKTIALQIKRELL